MDDWARGRLETEQDQLGTVQRVQRGTQEAIADQEFQRLLAGGKAIVFRKKHIIVSVQ